MFQPVPAHRVDPLISAEQIATRVVALADELVDALPPAPVDAPDQVVLLPLLKGAFMFAGDLARALHQRGLDLRVEFLKMRSYGARTSSTGRVRVDLDLRQTLRGARVLLLDDILDTGFTLTSALRQLSRWDPGPTRTVVLLDKPERREVEGVHADHVGFVIPDRFVVGYGIDYAERYRARPDVGVVVFEEEASAAP